MATPPAPAPVRLRLVFENRRLLRRAQREDDLRRCWLLLRPELATVADLAAHVTERFRLHRSCPHGVVFSMDGFSLPPFESICIFRDKDIIRVKQKACKRMVQHNDVHRIQDPEIVEKRPLPIDDEILAIEYQMDNSKHQVEEVQRDHQFEENVTTNHNVHNEDTSSKRKWQDGDARVPESSKKKKLKVTSSEKHIDCNKEDNMCLDKGLRGSKMMRPSIDTETKNGVIQAEATVSLEEEQKTERNNPAELKCETEVADCNAQSASKKVMSRNSRRKKLKRQLKQKAKEQQKEELQTAAGFPLPSNQVGTPCSSGKQNDSHLPFSNHEADGEESETSDDTVAVVVRPGHIRFESAGRDPDKSPMKEMQATVQWNGTMSKKKGQKLGMDNLNKKNIDTSYHGRMTGSSSEDNRHMADSKTAEKGDCAIINQKAGESAHDRSANEKTVAEEEKSSCEPLDFESLYPLTRLPKEGDLIVYRLLELSSSWCPELSSYRVGEVLIYDSISMRIILLPVLEYPIVTEEKEGKDKSDMQVDMSHYKEDGSLEIEYSSLLDVRLLKGNESVTAAVSTPRSEIEITKNKVWEKGETSNDKAEVQENGWETWTPNASTSAWSYRALRSSALGPTVAFLRGTNSKRGKPPNRKYSK